MEDKKLSIREVSRLSGVSVSTVSRIINQTGRFSKKTEEKVFQVMKELNYVPNRLAQSMRTHNNQTVGILIPDILNEPHALMVRTIQMDLLQAGYITTIFNTGENTDVIRRCIEMMRSQRMMGMVCIPSRCMTGEEVTAMPTVYLERRPPLAPKEDSLLLHVDDEQVGYMAGQALLAHGCKRMCVLMDEEDLLPHQQRLAGFAKALAEQGLQLNPEMILRGQSHKTTATLSLMQKWVDQPDVPDGVFAMELRPALGTLTVMRDHHWPAHLVGFGRLRLTDYGLLDLDSVYEPVREMAHEAAVALLKLIEEGPESAGDKVFQPIMNNAEDQRRIRERNYQEWRSAQ